MDPFPFDAILETDTAFPASIEPDHSCELAAQSLPFAARNVALKRQDARSNYLLDQLAPDEGDSLRRYGAEIGLIPGAILQEAGDPLESVYFPNDGLITLLMVTHSGSIAEAGFMGADGGIGTNYDHVERISFLRATVAVRGTALRVPLEHFENVLVRSSRFRHLIEQNNNRTAQRTQQIAACNLLHQLEPRVCRWLLQIIENSPGFEIAVTQDSLAKTLGVNRARLNETLKALCGINAIAQSSRGALQVTNASVVAERACECYSSMHGHRMM